MARSRRAGLILALAVAACAPPVLVLVAALGARTGLWDARFAHDIVAWRIGPVVAVVGALAALVASAMAWRRRAGMAAAAVAIIVSLATLGGYGLRFTSLRGGPDAATTNGAEPPAWGPLAGRRGAAGPESFAECAVSAVPSQAAPESVVYVLQRHGVQVVRAGVTGVYGVKPGFWFGFDQDVAIRIRPGRTDVRVAARDRLRHDGSACRLARRIAEDLTID